MHFMPPFLFITDTLACCGSKRFFNINRTHTHKPRFSLIRPIPWQTFNPQKQTGVPFDPDGDPPGLKHPFLFSK